MPSSNRSGGGGNELVGAFGGKGRLGDSAKMQAVTRVNVRRGPETFDVDADPPQRRRRPALWKKPATSAFRRSAGVKTMACIEGTHGKHGKPTTMAAAAATDNPRGPGPVASVAERFIGAKKPGNAGGAKGPQFKDQRTQEESRG
jgi:hypothetical protein